MTFSIAALDQETNELGVAITTSSIAVGSRCPWVEGGTGAVVTQNITNPILGPMILDHIDAGEEADQAIQSVVSSQEQIEYRQLIAVDIDGGVGHFTGKHILGKNAVAVGECCVAAGNLLANENVPQAMIDSFVHSIKSKCLSESLIVALQAGLDAGGEEGPVHSAALLVASGYLTLPDVNLRVDWADQDPVSQLFDLWKAYEPQRADYTMRAIDPREAPSYGVPGDL